MKSVPPSRSRRRLRRPARSGVGLQRNGFEGVLADPDLEANEVPPAIFGFHCDQHPAHVVEIDRDELDLCALAD
jgi:hypothetical protein